MPKVKISEFSATAANNTDIDGINLGEGMLPSDVNNAIRELMSQLKDFQAGTVGDSFNGPIGTSTAAAGNFTTLSATGVSTFSAGTVSAPAITTTGDTNTGMFFPAADTIAFSEGGVEAMRIDSAGNVGIGTATPLSATNRTVLTLQNNEWGGQLNIAVAGTTHAQFGTDNFISGLSCRIQSQDGIVFRGAADAERMRIDTTGNVGIGVNPVAKLQVDGNIRVSNGAGFTTANSLIRQIEGVSGAGNQFTIGSIGFFTGNFSDAGQIVFSTNNSGSNTERMRIDSSGNVQIGSSSNSFSARLYAVESSATEKNNLALYTTGAHNTTRIALYNDASSGSIQTIGNALSFSSNGVGSSAERMRIASNGIVTMSAYGAGAATFSAAGVISSVSDETWKTKDGIPANPDEMLQKLQPGYWFYNEEKAPIFGTDRQLGFYAQNVNEAIGNEAAPTPEKGKPWGYYDRSVLAVAVMSLKNALSTIEELKERIATLENK